jgi:hypothetical protein
MKSMHRFVFALVPLAVLLAGMPAPAKPGSPVVAQADPAPKPPDGDAPPAQAEPAAKPPDGDAPPAKAEPAPGAQDGSPPPPASEVVQGAAPATAAGEPLYSLDAHRQDAENLIEEFARRAKQPLTFLDQYSSLVSVQFHDLPFEKALRHLVQAADLDYVKNEEGYTVGLPIDLKLHFASDQDSDQVVEATYRCRRIDAGTLAADVDKLLGGDNIKVALGPAFLTPAVESVSGSDDSGVKALNAVDISFRTHDVAFSGKISYVRRALALARKFDRPRKQVRVKVRIMEMTTTFARSLGVEWMNSLEFDANEVGNGTTSASGAPQVNGIQLGKFTHSALSLTATLNAAETSGKTKTLSSPTLMVLDGEKAFILSGVKYVYPKITTMNSTGQSVYDVTTEREGIYLQVGVQVGLDDDMVLTLYPQVTSLQEFQVINGAQYPIIDTVEEQATVRALQGEVIVLGGLKQNAVNDTTTSLPFLSHIPILGKLFSSASKTTSDQEMVFFLTPEIVEDPGRPIQMKMTVTPAS